MPSDFIPVYKPKVTDQFSQIQDGNYAGWWGNHQSCVGHALANVLSVQYYKHTGMPKVFSHVYIYGKRRVADDQWEWRIFEEALECLTLPYFGFVEYADCPGDGFYANPENYPYVWANRFLVYRTNSYSSAHPPAQRSDTDYLDFGSGYTSARARAANATGTKYTIAGYDDDADVISKANISSVQSAITTYGSILMHIDGTRSLDIVGDDGIVEDLGVSEDIIGHAVCALGWKYINGALYWIAINSWGEGWGEKGMAYIPASAAFIYAFYRVRYVLNPNSLIPEPPEVTGVKIESGGIFTQSFNVGVSRKICFQEIGDDDISGYDFPKANTQITISDLSSATSYLVWTETTLSTGGSLTSGKATFTVLPYTPDADNIEFVRNTIDSITLKLSLASGGGYIVWYKNNLQVDWAETYISNATIRVRGYEYKFSNLSPGTEYTFKFRARHYIDDVTYQDSLGYYQLAIRTNSTRPGIFSWTNPKISGGTFNLTSAEWIRLCDNIIAVLEYRQLTTTLIGPNSFGLSEDTTYYTIAYMAKTKDTLGNTAITGGSVDTFTARAFNYARYCIGSINPTVPEVTDVSPGTTITANMLNTLVDKLNAIP